LNRKRKFRREAVGITGISVAGFKSIVREQRIEIRPLTILAGANNSGKSSIMQPLLLLKQTLESGFDPGGLLLNGPNLSFRSASEFLSWSDGYQEVGFRVGLELGSRPRITLAFRGAGDAPPTIDFMRYGGTELRSGMSPAEVFAAAKDLARDEKRVASAVAESLNVQASGSQPPRWSLVPHRCFLQFNVQGLGDTATRAIPVTDTAADQILRTIHVPGHGGPAKRVYGRAHVGDRFAGPFEPYAPSVIERWQGGRDRRRDRLEEWLKELGLTAHVEARAESGGLELKIGRLPRKRPNAGDLVNVADVGFGVSQVLPALVALLAAAPGDLVYVEDPESHLHPRAQVKMAEILADAAGRGVRVVAETHSSLILRGVQTLVARGKLEPDLIKLHWFKRSPLGVTRVHSGELDAAGAYGENWPEDFDDVQLGAEAAYLDAAEKRSA
jgi:hypothetical protein